MNAAEVIRLSVRCALQELVALQHRQTAARAQMQQARMQQITGILGQSSLAPRMPWPNLPSSPGWPEILDAAILSATTLGLLRIAAKMRLFPDPAVPTTLGWRWWSLDLGVGVLRSPHRWTAWHDAELRCDTWSESAAVRGEQGIHAHLVPWDWRNAPMPGAQYGSTWDAPPITGLVERFGKFVLGSEGWRAEWAVIRTLHAPNRACAAALAVPFPDMEISCGNR